VLIGGKFHTNFKIAAVLFFRRDKGYRIEITQGRNGNAYESME
jgi:hypothetical protein